jgi:phospholipid N-methyltransferase
VQGNIWHRKQLFFENEYIKIRVFKNGNAHIYLQKETRDLVNRALADFYGEVVPDDVPRGEDEQSFKAKTGTSLTTNLAFYPSPDAVADKAAEELHPAAGNRILEPSAGTGSLIRGIFRHIESRNRSRHSLDQINPDTIKVDAIEVSAARCDILRSSGLCDSVVHGNFLGIEPTPIYDRIILNPPFNRTSYMSHVRHAYDFLAENGKMVAILPITAAIGESKIHAQFHRWIDSTGHYARWVDLPTASFAESGTNISTTMLILRK